MYLMARRFALLRDICQQDQPWISMMQYFIDSEHEGLVHGKTMIQASWWPLFNGCIQWMYSSKDSTLCMQTTIANIMATCIIFFRVGTIIK